MYSSNEERSTEKKEFAAHPGTGKRKAQEVQKEVIDHGTWRLCLGKAAGKVEEKRNEPMHVLALVDDCWMKPVLLQPSSNNVAIDSASIAAKHGAAQQSEAKHSRTQQDTAEQSRAQQTQQSTTEHGRAQQSTAEKKAQELHKEVINCGTGCTPSPTSRTDNSIAYSQSAEQEHQKTVD